MPGLSNNLTEEQINVYKEAFQLYDRDQTGLISASELGDVIRASGQNPNEADVNELLKKRDIDRSGNLDFSEFLRLVIV